MQPAPKRQGPQQTATTPLAPALDVRRCRPDNARTAPRIKRNIRGFVKVRPRSNGEANKAIAGAPRRVSNLRPGALMSPPSRSTRT